MDLLTLPLLFAAFWGAKWSGKDFYSDGFSLKKTKSLRGLLALLVIFHHLYVSRPEGYLYVIYDLVGVLCVAVFFFLSGYGLEISARSKPGYGRKILTKRIPAIAVPYLIFTGIYWMASFLHGSEYSVQQVLVGLINGSPIVTNGWYIHCLLALYLVFALGQAFLTDRFVPKLCLHLLFSAVWVCLCRLWGYAPHWYNTVIAFPAGIGLAQWEPALTRVLKKRYWLFFSGCTAVFLAALAAALITAGDTILVPLFWLAMVLFALLLYLILMKLSIQNRLLEWLGEFSFEIYGIHGFFLYLYLPHLKNSLVWGCAVILSSVAAAWLLHKALRRILPCVYQLLEHTVPVAKC